ncbi:alpha/beta hydrolase family protein [Sphingomicrobium marinum]|uniref:alpha/beta hydrolase family protein n=1 Tax=Sphingomicrobium marinum TaxID=1227950 RepID=UPI00223EDE05|nr:S9 family peptidase [Sphingomicrobium marinum]
MRFFLVALLGILGIGAPAASQNAAPTRMTTADFAAQQEWSNPRLSPDGSRIALVMHDAKEKRIVILDAENPQTVIRQALLGEPPLQALRWAGNDRLLIKLQTYKPVFGFTRPADRLFIYDISADRSYEAAPEFNGTYSGDLVYVDRSGEWALVAGQNDQNDYPSIRRVDLSTGKSKQIQHQMRGVWDWYADRDGVVRAAIQYSKTNDFALQYRDNEDDKFKRITINLQRDSDDEIMVESIFLSLTDAPSTAISNHRKGRFGVYEFDLQRGRIGEPIFEHPTHDIDSYYLDNESGSVLGIRYQDDRPRIHWLDEEMKRHQARIDRALPGMANRIASFASDRNRMIIHSSRGADPGLYYLLDIGAGRMDVIANPYERVDPDQLSPVQHVEYRARDGLEIDAYLTLPKDREATNLPLVLLPHGGPFARDTWSYDPLVQFIASLGYAVLQPNFRGSTGRGREFVEKGYGQFGTGMMTDMYDGIDWLAAQGIVDPKRVCIAGASYGGYAAMWGAIDAPERFRCAVSYAGISDLASMRRYDRKLLVPVRYTEFWRDMIAGDVDAMDDLDHISPLNYARRLAVPMFIAHGKKDRIVPVEQSEKMIAALHRAEKPFDWMIYEESAHGFDEEEEFDDFLRRLAAFLAQHNPA